MIINLYYETVCTNFQPAAQKAWMVLGMRGHEGGGNF